MSSTNDLLNVLNNLNKNKTGAYDTKATVVRVEGDTAWVHIAGGVDETPIQRTINCKAGDNVQVRVSGGRGWITGNTSAPPTDDAVANVADAKAVNATNIATEAGENALAALLASESAQNSARRAEQAANDAEESASEAAQAASDAWDKASDAETAASTAQSRANDAYTAASNAQTSANNAQASAHNANEYASRALGNLTTVQSVAETLTWITQHGTMALTSDTSIDPTHVYFVVDTNGDYVVGSTHYSIVTEPETSALNTYYELTIDESLNNYVGTHLALTSEGLWLLPAASGTNKVLIATGAGTTYTNAGTYIVDSNGATLASFRANGITIGEFLSDKSRIEILSEGLQFIHNDSGSDVTLAHFGYKTNSSGSAISPAPYYDLGVRNRDAEEYDSTKTYRIGDLCENGGLIYVCKINMTAAENWDASHWAPDIGQYSIVEGWHNIASLFAAHAEGTSTKALGGCSHAEGDHTAASGYVSHAEGYSSVARGDYSHGEGLYGRAQGEASHGEGYDTQAIGDYSHAQNESTIAARKAQTALGRFNVFDPEGMSGAEYGRYALIIGNGTASNNRSNAMTVDWSGNVDIVSGAKYKINGADLSASDVGAVSTNTTVNGHALSSNVTVSASDVGAVPTSRTVNGKALSSDISLTASDVGAISTETDPTVPSWAKASTKPTYTASEVGAVPTTRTVNNKALSSDITLAASDVGAVPTTDITGSQTANYTGSYTLGKCTIITGSVTIKVNTANSNTDKAVSFGVTFKYAPCVQCTMLNIGGSYYQRVTAAGLSRTGFNCRIRAGGTPGDIIVVWVAIGELA